VGLPLRADDGGATKGWNGKINNIGSGGCMGVLLPLTEVTNSGYAGASSDGGHSARSAGFDCGFGVNQSSHTLNTGLLKDFSLDHLIWQTRWPKALIRTYYGRAPERTYWTGCSQGGRQGHILAQTIPEEYDGILAGGSGSYLIRFALAQTWPGLVIKDMLKTKGKTLSQGQIAAATQLAIAACDAQDELSTACSAIHGPADGARRARSAGRRKRRRRIVSIPTRRPRTTSFARGRAIPRASSSGSPGSMTRRFLRLRTT
jgi:hypothetical protein